jgi:hypothetical protein
MKRDEATRNVPVDVGYLLKRRGWYTTLDARSSAVGIRQRRSSDMFP